jgi:hypothetical protein
MLHALNFMHGGEVREIVRAVMISQSKFKSYLRASLNGCAGIGRQVPFRPE